MFQGNTYWVLRHGRSKANEAGIIVSSVENGIKPEYGLSESGFAQAAAAGELLQQQLLQAGADPCAVLIYTSPFSRTLETAQTAAAAAGIDTTTNMHVTPLLAERYFGSALELTSHDNYELFWSTDAQHSGLCPPGSVDGESVLKVSQRVQELFQELESKHQGQHILLVSHGDTLSILQAAYLYNPLALSSHTQYGLATGQLKCLNPAGQVQLESHVCGSAVLEGCSSLKLDFLDSSELVEAAAAGVGE